MIEKTIEILKRIQGEVHLSKLLNSKIKNPLIARNLSLHEIYELDDDYFIKMEGNGVGKLKYLNEFKEQVNLNPSYFDNYQTYVLDAPIVLGQSINNEESLVFHIEKCLNEISNLLRYKTTLPSYFFDKVECNSYLPLSNYMDHYFGINDSSLLSYKEISLKYNKTPELIRINLFENKNKADLCKLFNSESDFGLVINPELTHLIRATLANNLYNDSILNVLTNDENVNSTKLKRIVEIFKYELIETNFENSDAGFYTLVKKEETLIYRSHVTIIDAIFRENVCLTKEELIDQIKQEKPSKHKSIIEEKGINTAIIDALLATYYKLEIIQEEEAVYYQFKWHYLSSMAHKLARILQENGTSMLKEEILNEYNTRASDLSVEILQSIDDLHIKKTNKIKPIGKLGRWFYSENEGNALQETIEKFINKSIVEKFKGKITFEELKEYVANSPYSLYPENNLRANLLLCCRKVEDDDKLFIHQDFLTVYPELKTVEKRNRYLANAMINTIVKIIRDANGNSIDKDVLRNKTIDSLKSDGFVINKYSSYYAYLFNFTDSGLLIKKEINNTIFYSIDEEELKNHDLNTLGKKSEPEYKKKIRAYSINHLKKNKRIKLSELKDEIGFLMPSDISYSSFYKIFQDKAIFIKEQIGTETWISLETSLLPVPQELHVEVTEEVTELLGTTALTERVRYDVSKLKLAVINELYSEMSIYKMSKEVLSDSFEIFYIALSDQNGIVTKWGDSLLQSVYELLCTKTDYYDRETCLNKLITGYETFLKCFINKSETNIFSGQSEVIHHFTPISELRNYRYSENNKENVQKKDFSYILSRIKFLSDKSRHDKLHESLDMSFNKQIKNAIDFIALYLYSGYLIKEN